MKIKKKKNLEKIKLIWIILKKVIKNNKLILKTQQKFTSKNHNVFTGKILRLL